MSLSAEQLAARKGKLTASRVAALMTGNAEKIMQLWLEMTDQAEPENLDDVWPVRLGEATEKLNLDWFEAKNGPLSRRGEVVVHKKYSWAAATLDAWYDGLNCPVESKHVGGREPFEVIVDRYQPQMQWQMECTGASECALSVIMGANEPMVDFIPFDLAYATEMIARGEQFMRFVRERKPPVVLEAIAPPCDPTKIIDMSGDNLWAAAAADWLASKGTAELCRAAEKVLKSKVPEDAKKCHGAGVQITRDRAGRLSLRIEQ
jgi:predicted phage-related endonuclease